jgi:hypothetical protein
MELRGENTLNCNLFGICGIHINFKIKVHIHCSGIHYIAQVVWQDSTIFLKFLDLSNDR